MGKILSSYITHEAAWFVPSNWQASYTVITPWLTDEDLTPSNGRKTRYLFHRLVSHTNLLNNLAKEAVCYIDKHWNIQSLNAEGERLLGVKLSEVENQPFTLVAKLLDVDTGSSLLSYQHLALCYQHNEVFRHEDAILRRSDNTDISVEFAFCPLMQDQQFIGAVVLMRDVSQIKRLEQTLLTNAERDQNLHADKKTYLNETSKERLEFVYASEHDVLTGLLNRYQFEIKLQELIKKTRVFGVTHGILSLDLDLFKVVNDACGHLAGDECLRQIARILEGKIRKWDLLARLGGDEFAVQLLYCTQQQALRIADDISRAIHKHRFIWKGMSFSFSTSIGVVIIDNRDTDANNVMRKADLACNTAKEQGRNRTFLFDDENAHIHTRHGEVSCIGQITNALEENRFDIFVQKIIPIQNQANELDHYEILVRMFDQNGEYLSPGLFLPAAERYNMISRIDGWVVRRTCELLAAHPERIQELGMCAINLSGSSLNDQRFFDYVLGIIQEFKVPLEKLCFEVTETGAIANINNAIKFITRLRALGIHFALDDFGSGLSSFAYLRSLPVDYVKIDGMFIKAMDTNEIDCAMVKSINEMAHIMGKKTVAEFVENAKILSMLREMGVDYAQGYGIAKPTRFSDYLERKN